jgi:putative membrane protein
MNLPRVARTLGVLLLASTAVAAFAQAGNDPDRMGSGTNDASFMRQAAADGLAEIQMGQLALHRTSSAPVRELAQRIVDDHTKANTELAAIAERLSVTLPTAPMPMQKQAAEKLRAASDAAFDQAYANEMVKDHRTAIKLFGMHSEHAADSGLRQFASATLPVLKTHLQMAEQIAGPARGEPAMHHTGATPMDSSGSMGMPASGSSTR